MTLLIVVLIGVLVILAGGFAMAMALRTRSRAAAQRLDAAIDGRPAELRGAANLFGVRSAGAMQVRGNGHIALTADELAFSQLVPERVIHVPRSRISAVRTESSYLGKAVGRELLVVTWDEDEAAFYVRDLDRWVDALGG